MRCFFVCVFSSVSLCFAIHSFISACINTQNFNPPFFLVCSDFNIQLLSVSDACGFTMPTAATNTLQALCATPGRVVVDVGIPDASNNTAQCKFLLKVKAGMCYLLVCWVLVYLMDINFFSFTIIYGDIYPLPTQNTFAFLFIPLTTIVLTVSTSGIVVPGTPSPISVTGIINPGATAFWSKSAVSCLDSDRVGAVFNMPVNGQITATTIDITAVSNSLLYICLKNGADGTVPFDPQPLASVGTSLGYSCAFLFQLFLL